MDSHFSDATATSPPPPPGRGFRIFCGRGAKCINSNFYLSFPPLFFPSSDSAVASTIQRRTSEGWKLEKRSPEVELEEGLRAHLHFSNSYRARALPLQRRNLMSPRFGKCKRFF